MGSPGRPFGAIELSLEVGVNPMQKLKAGIEALCCCSEPLSERHYRVDGASPKWNSSESCREYRTEWAVSAIPSGGWQLRTREEFAELIEKLHRPVNTTGLSPAALETLAIIAYKQPVTRAVMERIRGVRVDSALQSLLERELVEELGRLDEPGRPILYGTTLSSYSPWLEFLG